MNHPVDSLLTSVRARIIQDPAMAMLSLIDGLRVFRSRLPDQLWKRYVEYARKSPLCEILHTDPFTYRAFSKPRGYPGDAALLDMIYYREPPPGLSGLADRIFSWTTASPAPEAVRQRRQALAEMIDEHCEDFENASVLSVASGHLREAELSRAVCDRRFKRYVAFDQDRESLSEVDSKYGALGVTSVAGSVREIVTRKVELSGFTFVYSLVGQRHLGAEICRKLGIGFDHGSLVSGTHDLIFSTSIPMAVSRASLVLVWAVRACLLRCW